jgi:hypothetical protein
MRQASGDDVADEIDGDSIRRAGLLVTYFKSHAMKVYASLGADPRVRLTQRVIKWILSVNRVNIVNTSQCVIVSVRDIHANVLGSRKTVEDAEKVAEYLVKLNYFRPIQSSYPSANKEVTSKQRGRATSPKYQVNPKIFTRSGSQSSLCSQKSKDENQPEA